MKTGAVETIQSWVKQHSNKSRHPSRLPPHYLVCITLRRLPEGCQHFVCTVTPTTVIKCGQVTATVCYKKTVHMKEFLGQNEQMNVGQWCIHKLIQGSLPDCTIYGLYKGRQQTSHLIGKSDIPKGVRTEDQLPLVVTTAVLLLVHVLETYTYCKSNAPGTLWKCFLYQ